MERTKERGARANLAPAPRSFFDSLNISAWHPIFGLEDTADVLPCRRSLSMEPSNLAIAPQGYAEARRMISECWIYTRERGLRAMTLHGNGSALAIDGQRLIRWCILDDAVPRSIVAYLYSAEKPTAEMRDRVSDLARERFADR